MRVALQYFFSVIILLLVAGVERAVGLPLFFLTLTLLFLISQPLVERMVLWVIIGILWGSIYAMPFTLSLLLLLIGIAGATFPFSFLRRESLKVLSIILLLTTMTGFFLHFQWNLSLVIYHMFGVVGSLFVLRWWYAQRDRKGMLSFLPSLKKKEW